MKEREFIHPEYYPYLDRLIELGWKVSYVENHLVVNSRFHSFENALSWNETKVYFYPRDWQPITELKKMQNARPFRFLDVKRSIEYINKLAELEEWISKNED